MSENVVQFESRVLDYTRDLRRGLKDIGLSEDHERLVVCVNRALNSLARDLGALHFLDLTKDQQDYLMDIIVTARPLS